MGLPAINEHLTPDTSPRKDSLFFLFFFFGGPQVGGCQESRSCLVGFLCCKWAGRRQPFFGTARKAAAGPTDTTAEKTSTKK